MSQARGSSKPRVVVVDDERNLRELLHVALGDEGFEVRSAADGRGAVELVRDWAPDVIVLDVMLPHVDGLALLPVLRRLTEAPIVMLSAKSDPSDKIVGLQSGADDYLAKPFEIGELVARLRTALRRPRLELTNHLRFADLFVDVDTRGVVRNGRRIDLSAREFALLLVFMRNPNRIFDRDRLLDLVWGSEREVTPGTVDTYVSYLRAKLERGDEIRLIRTVRGAGYALRSD